MPALTQPSDSRARRGRLVRAAGPLAGLLAAGCDAVQPPAWETLQPVTDYGRAILDLYGDIFWWTFGIFVVVELLLLYALVRYRHRGEGFDVPNQVHGHSALEVGWTLLPAAILFFIAIPTVRTIFQTQRPSPNVAERLEVAVIGHQWWWEFVYPELGISTANELHIPTGQEVRLSLTSADVIHSFWVPRLGGKRDLNPGSENSIWFTAESTGVFEGQCAEFCGLSHANMRMRVFVDDPDSFARWVAGQGAVAAPDSAGFQTFLASGCAACHAIGGTPAQGRIGPDLTHVGSRTTIAAGLLPNTPERMAGWLRDPDSVKPGALMPDLNLSEERIRTLVSFLAGLK